MNGNKIYNSGSIYPFILTFFSFTSSSFFFEKILRIIYIYFSFIERAISRSTVSKYYLEVSINYKQVSSKHFKQIIGETKGTEMNGNKIYNSVSIYPFILSFFSFTSCFFFFEKILRVIYIFSFIERTISLSQSTVSKYYLEISINYKVSSKHFKQIIGETKGMGIKFTTYYV